jgi:hypothetical protein
MECKEFYLDTSREIRGLPPCVRTLAETIRLQISSRHYSSRRRILLDGAIAFTSLKTLFAETSRVELNGAAGVVEADQLDASFRLWRHERLP